MPSNNSAKETTFVSSTDGTKLFYEYVSAATPKAYVLLVHGFADHCGRYASMAAQLAERGYGVMRYDYRGHGRSDGRRGHIFQFSEYVDDFSAVLGVLRTKMETEVPVFVMAHSYGGLITMHAAAEHEVDGIVLSSPFFGFAIKVPAWKTFAGRLLSRYIPGLSLPTDVDAAIVSHDPATIEEYATDPLIGRVATARWLTETEKAHARVPGLAQSLGTPILYQQAGDDRLVDAGVGREIFEQMASTDKTWMSYGDQFHEIWFELDRQPTLDAAYTWLADRT